MEAVLPRWVRSLGLVALAFYAAHAVDMLVRDDPGSLLWMCQSATLLVGIGLLAASPAANAIGALWLLLGNPLWLLDLATGGVLYATSVLRHLGGLALALLGVRWLGMPRGAWWRALAGLVLLQLLTRAVTPERENVNLVFRVWHGWETTFPSYPLYWLMMCAIAAATFALGEVLLRAALVRSKEYPNQQVIR